MGERGAQQAAEAQEQFNAQIRTAAGTADVARRPDRQGEGAARLGAIDQAEFDKLKAAALA